MTKAVPLQVRAHLAAGIAQAAPWGIALDGLLASQLWSEHKIRCRAAGQPYERALDQDDPSELALPLARCTVAGDLWHWAATCAFPEQTPNVVDIHTWTGRVDARPLEQMTNLLPKTISDRQGRYRARRMPLLVTPCVSVTWRAIGDIEAITQLLSPIKSIGKKRSSGEGHVLGWEITPAPEIPTFDAGHLHPDGSLGRPCPINCLERLGRPIANGGCGTAGLRPPYMHPARQHELTLPSLLGL